MQQMTGDACKSANIGDSKQLTDIRDGKKYWVTKIKNNNDDNANCWMTQNLDFDLVYGQTLTPETTDLLADWQITATTQKTDTPSFTNQHNDIQSYDPGNKYCNNSNCNATSSANDGHDHQGNYYSWRAATAGIGNTSFTIGNASSSICPKGWMLSPTSGINSSSYFALLDGIATGNGLLKSPYYFTFSGNVLNRSIDDIGSTGSYWSSTANGADAAYFLYFNASGIIPSNNLIRYYGFSVRCVAR